MVIQGIGQVFHRGEYCMLLYDSCGHEEYFSRTTARVFDQIDVEAELYAAAEVNHLVADDGERQCWATIRSGLSAGMQQPIDLDADRR